MKKCINSIKNQRFKNYEVWIVDGLSSDGTKEYLKTLKKPFNWISGNDLGVYEAMNKGVESANGIWLYFLGVDDKLYNNKTLERIFLDHRKYDNVDLIFGKIKYISNDKSSYFVKKNDGIISSSFSYKMWIYNTVHHQGVFYKSEIFLNREYSLKYKILSDYKFNLNLFRSKIKYHTTKNIIAICMSNGLSKNYDWQLYKEEITIKTNQSTIFFKPFFYLVGLAKFLIKKKL